MSEFLQIPYKVAVLYDYLRSIYCDNGQTIKLLRSYSRQDAFISDGNSGNFWDKKFESGIEKMHFMAKDRNRAISRLLCNKKGRWLNVGVGNGELERLCFGKKNFNLFYLGTDIAISTISKLRKLFPAADFRLMTFKDLLDIQANDYSFVTLLEVYEHLQPIVGLSLLRQIRRLLSDDGILIISVPVNENLPKILPNNPNQHMRILTEQLIISELNLCGFKVNKVKRLVAFNSLYNLKKLINTIFLIRKTNNLILYCSKKTC